MNVEIDPERLKELQSSFDNSMASLGSSLVNGDLAKVIFTSIEAASQNPLCVSLISLLFVWLGFRLFVGLARSFSERR